MNTEGRSTYNIPGPQATRACGQRCVCLLSNVVYETNCYGHKEPDKEPDKAEHRTYCAHRHKRKEKKSPPLLAIHLVSYKNGL